MARISLPDVFNGDGLPARWLILASLAAALAVISRSPKLFLHPQFFAEDGAVFYAQAYNSGWLHTLILPYEGYLVMVQRLGAGLAMLLPFRWSPLPMSLTGLFFQVLPVPLLLSSRCRRWSPLSMRLAFAVAYIAIPNAREIHVVCTNAQWHLALVLTILAFAAPPESLAVKVSDIVLAVLGALTGPFGILLIPFVAVFWYVRRYRWSVVLFATISLVSIAQLIVLFRDYSHRPKPYLGASLALFIKLLGGNAFIGTLLGSRSFGAILPLACSLGMLLIGIALCIYCARSLTIEVELFFVYCFMVFIAAIRIRPFWPTLVQVPSLRYLFFPSLPLLFAVLWCAGFARNRVARVTGIVLTLLLCVGICSDWRIHGMPDIDLRHESDILKEAKPGEHVALNIEPPGWFMVLIKR